MNKTKKDLSTKLNKLELIKAKKSKPIYWINEDNQIKRVLFNPLERKVKAHA